MCKLLSLIQFDMETSLLCNLLVNIPVTATIGIYLYLYQHLPSRGSVHLSAGGTITLLPDIGIYPQCLSNIRSGDIHGTALHSSAIKLEIHGTCHSVTFYFMKKQIFWYQQEVYFAKKWLGRLTDCTHSIGQFTPKMKANAKPRLLSSLVWIDSGWPPQSYLVKCTSS